MNWNKIKYWLGLRCVVEVDGKFLVSKRFAGLVRVYQSKTESYWWTEGYALNYCAYDTLQEAYDALDKFVCKPV